MLIPRRGCEACRQGPSVPPRSQQWPDGCFEGYLQAEGEGKAEGWVGGFTDPRRRQHLPCLLPSMSWHWRVGGGLVILP